MYYKQPSTFYLKQDKVTAVLNLTHTTSISHHQDESGIKMTALEMCG
jgi:hypothetical protein